jgi:hypothetical protein
VVTIGKFVGTKFLHLDILYCNAFHSGCGESVYPVAKLEQNIRGCMSLVGA